MATGHSPIFEVTRADGKTAGFRFADHLNTSSQAQRARLQQIPTPDSSGVAFSRKLPATIEVDGQQRPTTYTTYRGVSHEGPNDYGVAGNGEYSSGRRQVAESYAGKDGKVESRTVTLNNPLSLTYAELNDLQTKLYGKPLTGFEKGCPTNSMRGCARKVMMASYCSIQRSAKQCQRRLFAWLTMLIWRRQVACYSSEPS